MTANFLNKAILEGYPTEDLLKILKEQNHLISFILWGPERPVDRAVRDRCDHTLRWEMAVAWTSPVSSRAPKLSHPRTFLNGGYTTRCLGSCSHMPCSREGLSFRKIWV